MRRRKRYVGDMTLYGAARAEGIFDRFDDAVAVLTPFDFGTRANAGDFWALDEGSIGGDSEIRFVLNDGQRDTIRRILGVYGGGIPGLTRALTRTNLKRLLRNPI